MRQCELQFQLLLVIWCLKFNNSKRNGATLANSNNCD